MSLLMPFQWVCLCHFNEFAYAISISKEREMYVLVCVIHLKHINNKKFYMSCCIWTFLSSELYSTGGGIDLKQCIGLCRSHYIRSCIFMVINLTACHWSRTQQMTACRMCVMLTTQSVSFHILIIVRYSIEYVDRGIVSPNCCWLVSTESSSGGS